MAALLVGMSVAAVLMTAVLPVWRRMVQREREAELVFRGEQYVRAISLFQKRSGPGVLPPDVDTLVRGRFLRKKFKDPITNQDFDLLSPSQAAGTTGAAQPGAAQPGGGLSAQPPRPGAPNPTPAQPATSGAVIAAQSSGRGAAGGVIGVASKSKETSIRIYNGRSKYNEWQFIFVQQQAPGAGAPGQRGAGPGGGPVGRGGQPPQGGVGGGARGRGNVPTGPGGGGRQGQPTQPAPPSPFGPRPAR